MFINDLLKKIKASTLDKTSLDEKVVNFVKPKIQSYSQNAMASPLSLPNVLKQTNVNDSNSLASKFYRSKYSNPLANYQRTVEKGDFLSKYKQPDEIVKKYPVTSFTNSALGYGNDFMKVPTQVGYDLARIKKLIQLKESPTSAPVKFGTMATYPTKDFKALDKGARGVLLRDTLKQSAESVKPIAMASGLKAPKIVAGMTGLGGILGYGGAKIQGKKGKEALDQAVISSGEQFGRAITMAGLMRFTNPVGEKVGQITTEQLAKIGAPKFAQYLGKYTAQGAINSAEGVALNPLIDRPAFEDVVLDFLIPGFMDIGGKTLKGVTKGSYTLLRNAVKGMDAEGFDSAVRVLKDQGIKIADDAVSEVKKILGDQRGFIAPGEFVPGSNKVKSQQELYNIVKSGKGRLDPESGLVKVSDGSGNLINAGRLYKSFMDSMTVKENPVVATDLSGKTSDDFLRAPESGKVGTVVKGRSGEYGSDNIVARERFDIPNLTKLSSGGSDRDVYDLGNDVLKVTKTARGLDQNRMADYYASEAGLIPEIKEIGRNYVVFEKVGKPDANTKAMVKELNELGMLRSLGGTTNYDNIQKAYEIMEKHGYPSDDLANYGQDILWGDMKAIRNWGTKNGKPILVDEGSLNGDFVTTHMKLKQQGVKNLDNPEFRSIYDESRSLKKMFGDKDNNTMYGAMAGTEFYQDENGEWKVRFNPQKAVAGIAVASGVKEIRNGSFDDVMKMIGRDQQFGKYGDDLKEMIAGEAKRLADQVQGITKAPGEDGAMLRHSLNPKWYQDFYDSNGRAPNNKELFDLAEENLKTGKVDGFYQPDEVKAMSDYIESFKPLTKVDGLTDEVYNGIKENGGITISLGKNTPTDGYAYSPYKDSETVVDLTKFTPRDVDSFVEKYYDRLIQPGHHIGGWVDDGKVYLDISKVGAPGEATVLEVEKAGQLAVFDLKNFETIYTGLGKAQNEKVIVSDLNRGEIKGTNKSGDVESYKQVQGSLEKNGEIGQEEKLSGLLQLPKPVNPLRLQSPKEVITSKKRLLDVFKKTGVAKDYLNVQRPGTKAIPLREAVMPTYKASTTEDAKRIYKNYGVVPEFKGSMKSSGDVIEGTGQTIEGRQKRIEEILYGSATPSKEELGGTKQGAGILSNVLRKGVTKTSDVIAEGLENQNPIIRNTSRLMQGLFGNLGKSSDQITAKGEYKGGIEYAKKLAVDVRLNVNKIVNDSPESLERIHAVLDPELATTKVNYEDLTPEEKQATDFLKFVSDYINETNYKNGFISEDKYRSNTGGKYIARAYEPYEYPPEIADYLKQRNISFDLAPFKQRGDVTDWKVENAVRDPAMLVAKRLQQTMFNDNLVKMSNWLTSTDLVSSTAKPGFVQMSESKVYGDLSGKFIRKDALEDMRGFFFENKTAQNVYDALNSWDKLGVRQFRKKALTVFNPAVRLGNRTGNYVFAWLNGINPITFKVNKAWAKKAIDNNDPLYRRMLKDGSVRTDILKEDITRMATELKANIKDANILKKIDQVLQDSYGRVDDEAKISAMKTWLDRGYSYEEASKRVYNGFQNYNAVGFLYDIGAKLPVLGNPFVRFKSDILRMAKNAVVDHPVRAVGTLLAWQMFTDVMSKISGESAEDKETRENRLGAPRVPLTDISLAVQTPWGEVNSARLIGLYSMNTLGEGSNISDISKYAPFESPFVGTGDQKKLYLGQDPIVGPVASLITDTDFRGKSIADPDSNKYTGSLLTDEERNKNRLAYLMRSYSLPSMNDATDIVSAVKGEPNYYGQNRTPLQAVLRTAGLKVEQFGPEESQFARDKDAMYAQSKIEADQRKISAIRNQLSRGEINPEQAERRIMSIQNGIDKTTSTVSGSGSKTESSLSDTRVKSLNRLFGADNIESMPVETNYQKAQKKEKQFDLMTKVFDSDFLNDNEKADYLSKVSGYKPNDIKYYQVARGSTDERYGFILDKIETTKDLKKTLITLRYDMNEKRVLTNNLVDQLVDDGYISKSLGTYLKKIKYNETSEKLEISGGGSGSSTAKKTLKALLSSGEELQGLFDKQARSTTKSSGYSNKLSRIAQVNSAPKSIGTSIQSILSNKRKM